jgi:hypothetical protein
LKIIQGFYHAQRGSPAQHYAARELLDLYFCEEISQTETFSPAWKSEPRVEP